MNILAIETSTKILSIAVLTKNTCNEITKETKNHASSLLPLIIELLNKSGVEKENLDYIAVSSGPGSFTGLRIGASTAKAIAHGLNIPIISVPTLAALAYNFKNSGKEIIPVIDARRGTVYAQRFNTKNEIAPINDVETIHAIDLINNTKKEAIILGDGVSIFNNIDMPPNIKICYDLSHCAKMVGKLALQYISENSNIFQYFEYEPTYYKKTQAEREYNEKNNNS
ncbi:MAG: tRNA (adenosine(37)-N6)-threonylcarbamoyltransferase complex dimerization subunit type 1 TsaB [Lachnospirales bacterium]